MRVDEQSSKLLTIVKNIGRFTYKSLPQGICNRKALWNIMTDGESRMDSQLNIVKNMDDFLLYGRNLKEELKVEDEVGSQVEFGG